MFSFISTILFSNTAFFSCFWLCILLVLVSSIHFHLGVHYLDWMLSSFLPVVLILLFFFSSFLFVWEFLWAFLAVECCSYHYLGDVSTVLCGLWSLGNTIWDQAGTSEVDLSPALWTTRELLTAWNMLMLKVQYFAHLIHRADSLENTPMLGKIECKRRKEQQRMRWLDGITGSNT